MLGEFKSQEILNSYRIPFSLNDESRFYPKLIMIDSFSGVKFSSNGLQSSRMQGLHLRNRDQSNSQINKKVEIGRPIL